jgi:hypothetical protein
MGDFQWEMILRIVWIPGIQRKLFESFRNAVITEA